MRMATPGKHKCCLLFKSWLPPHVFVQSKRLSGRTINPIQLLDDFTTSLSLSMSLDRLGLCLCSLVTHLGQEAAIHVRDPDGMERGTRMNNFIPLLPKDKTKFREPAGLRDFPSR